MRVDIDRTLKILLTIILAAVVGYVGWQIVLRVVYPLELFVMGVIVAFILSPLVERLHRAHVPKPLAILIVYAAVLGVAVLLGYLLINPLVDQITKLTTELPKRLKDASLPPKLKEFNDWLNAQLAAHNIKGVDIQSKATDYVTNFAQNLGNLVVTNLYNVVLTSFSFIINSVLVLVIAFYLLMDGQTLKNRLYTLVPDAQLSRVEFVDETINKVLGGYLRGQLLMGLTIGTMAGAGTAILGVDYPVLIGVLAGILELVPMLGPWLASMPALLIAAFSPHPWPLILWVGLYFLIIQQLESNVIGPRITGRAVGLHPLAALMALLVGIELDGILGALFAVPVAAILFVLATAIYRHFRGLPAPEEPEETPPSWLFGGLGDRLRQTQLPVSMQRLAQFRQSLGDAGWRGKLPRRQMKQEQVQHEQSDLPREGGVQDSMPARGTSDAGEREESRKEATSGAAPPAA